MNNEDKIESAINRAARADHLLRDELLIEAFDQLRANYIAAWQVTAARDVAAREKLWQAVNIVGLVREHLGKVLAGGKLAQAELKMRQMKRAA
jgi:hypothetical protein